MVRVLLIVPRSPFLDSDRVFPPLGALYLKGHLAEQGIETEVEDNFDFKNPGKYQGFDWFGISAVTPQKKEAARILQVLKESFPSKKIILGGPHATFYAEECLALPYDHLVLGDGEKAVLELLFGETSQRVVRGELSVEQINSLPLPARERQFLARYQYCLDGLLATTMITSRGCPYRCDFCEHARTKVRYYTPQRLKQELVQVTILGYKAVMFFDDLFAINQKRVGELCLVISGFRIKFRCFGHVRQMTLRMAQTLAQAGCVEIGVGMESGSQKILNTVKFPTPTVKQGYDFVKICHRFGIRVKGFFVLGLPGETAESIEETEEFIANSGIDDFDLAIYYPYRGTKIREEIEKYDLFLDSTGDGLGYYKGKGGQTEALVRTSALSTEEICQARERIFSTYKKTTCLRRQV